MKSGLIPRTKISGRVRRLQRKGKKVVFTNGVFDILHRGHVEYLARAKREGDVLVVGLNSDASVRRIKGKSRPLQSEQDRAIILLALESVDYVVLFGEDRPDKLIEAVRPDVLVKGADYKLNEIAGAEFVRSYGGRVKRISLTKGRSSTQLIKKL
ncbi:MAG TPA: D-glycero-beta-D-manno-heptose 1-phosphate adenylyltransferase [candidate division Zixibacteria bacterium]|nr:D-glycero-beta-D-manno-heptose 1-phosphate adenylyltransferase [candidate division Zixibacteria bacterium]